MISIRLFGLSIPAKEPKVAVVDGAGNILVCKDALDRALGFDSAAVTFHPLQGKQIMAAMEPLESFAGRGLVDKAYVAIKAKSSTAPASTSTNKADAAASRPAAPPPPPPKKGKVPAVPGSNASISQPTSGTPRPRSTADPVPPGSPNSTEPPSAAVSTNVPLLPSPAQPASSQGNPLSAPPASLAPPPPPPPMPKKGPTALPLPGPSGATVSAASPPPMPKKITSPAVAFSKTAVPTPTAVQPPPPAALTTTTTVSPAPRQGSVSKQPATPVPAKPSLPPPASHKQPLPEATTATAAAATPSAANPSKVPAAETATNSTGSAPIASLSGSVTAHVMQEVRDAFRAEAKASEERLESSMQRFTDAMGHRLSQFQLEQADAAKRTEQSRLLAIEQLAERERSASAEQHNLVQHWASQWSEAQSSRAKELEVLKRETALLEAELEQRRRDRQNQILGNPNAVATALQALDSAFSATVTSLRRETVEPPRLSLVSSSFSPSPVRPTSVSHAAQEGVGGGDGGVPEATTRPTANTDGGVSVHRTPASNQWTKYHRLVVDAAVRDGEWLRAFPHIRTSTELVAHFHDQFPELCVALAHVLRVQDTAHIPIMSAFLSREGFPELLPAAPLLCWLFRGREAECAESLLMRKLGRSDGSVWPTWVASEAEGRTFYYCALVDMAQWECPKGCNPSAVPMTQDVTYSCPPPPAARARGWLPNPFPTESLSGPRALLRAKIVSYFLRREPQMVPRLAALLKLYQYREVELWSMLR